MKKELFLLSEKIKMLREKNGLTQSELAKSLNLTRSAVNAWEMGLSIPSTALIVELAKRFKVSTDYLLGMDETASISVQGLTSEQITAIHQIIQCFHNSSK